MVERVGEPQRELCDGECRCCMARGTKYRRSGDIKIVNAPDAAIFVDDAIGSAAAHPSTAHLVAGGSESAIERGPALQGLSGGQNGSIDVQATNVGVNEIAAEFEGGLAHRNAIIV